MAMTQETIFSLTDNGAALAHRILSFRPQAIHYHRPENFLEFVRNTFKHGNRCLFICSTGIVVRALSPVLKDKYQDPAVLVLDEHGKYVIPLLSGHEGGGSEWGKEIAKGLSAELVITSATDYSQPVYTIGMGCDRGCPLEKLESLYLPIAAQFPEARFLNLGSIDLKVNETGLLALSEKYGFKFDCFSAETLRRVEDQLSVKSEIVFKEVGCYGVAEAAALSLAAKLTGQPAELIVTKQKNSRATIAVARSYLPSERSV